MLPVLKRIVLSLAIVLLAFSGALVIDGLTDEPGRSDVGIVLGNKVNPDGKPSRRLAARLERALALYRAGDAPVLIVSGGVGKEGFDEAEVMADWLVARGVPARAIIVDSLGVDTQATAENAAAIMKAHGWRSATVVTQYFHVPRARLALRKQGVATVRGVHPDYFEWRDLYSIPREDLGYAAYLFRPQARQ